jgi:hypothetical protein
MVGQHYCPHWGQAVHSASDALDPLELAARMLKCSHTCGSARARTGVACWLFTR